MTASPEWAHIAEHNRAVYSHAGSCCQQILKQTSLTLLLSQCTESSAVKILRECRGSYTTSRNIIATDLA